MTWRTHYTLQELVTKSLAKAITARDNAKAETVVAECFKAEYLAGLSGSPTASPETHARSMQLYDFAMGSERRAREFTADAEVAEQIAEQLFRLIGLDK